MSKKFEFGKANSYQNLLIAEGITDCNVLASLYGYYDLSFDDFNIIEGAGEDGVIRKLTLLLKGSIKRKNIALIFDADNSAKNRWNSIRYHLEEHGYSNIPIDLGRNGTIVKSEREDQPNIGVWIMPNNLEAGMLEDFCSQLINPVHYNLAEEVVTLAENKEVTTFRSVHRSKAIIHTYLAWQDEPGDRLATAVKRGNLNPEHHTVKEFIDLLKNLYLLDH